jgi:hypothetical protein
MKYGYFNIAVLDGVEVVKGWVALDKRNAEDYVLEKLNELELSDNEFYSALGRFYLQFATEPCEVCVWVGDVCITVKEIRR